MEGARVASGRHTAAQLRIGREVYGNELRLTSSYRHRLGIQLPRFRTSRN